MKINIHFFCWLIACLSFHVTQGQVIINEISASNYTDEFDNFGETEDWVELYNAGDNPVNLEGYFLSDNIDNLTKWQFPAGITIDPQEHLLIWCSDRDVVVVNNIHAGFKLTQSRQEWVVLSDPATVLLDAYQMSEPTQMNHSRGRVLDGSASWGIFTNPTPGASNIGAFDDYATKPELSLEAGFYDTDITITMTAETDETIRYTTDGSEPTENDAIYNSPLTIPATTVVKAKSFSDDAGVLGSFTEANTYFIGVEHTLPVISIAGTDIADLLDGIQFDPIGSFELFREDGSFWTEAYGDFNKHGNDSWAYPQRGLDYITRDQLGYDSSLDAEIFPNKDRGRYQRLIIKSAANDNYPFEDGGAYIRDAYIHTLSQNADMELDERTNEPAVMYVNGEYWGLYELREKVDDPDYTRAYYDQGEKWLDFIKTWGGTWEEYGSRDDWDDLTDFITNNDMSVAANYDIVTDQLNVMSLVDYMIINTHVVCKDWLNWNTAWWRGRNPEGEAQKWRYALWDMDASFGHYVNYTGIPNDTPSADPCDNETYPTFSDPESHVQLIISLMENEDFHSLYVNRYADMNNSFLSCDYMIPLLDSMIARIEPEMQNQIDRWGGTYAEWESNVDDLRNFILGRCSFIDGGIVDCYDVEGPFPVTVNIEPANSPNDVRVNTFIPNSYPFSGDYFSGTTLSFEAVPDPVWELDHWEVDTNSFGPDEFAQIIDLQLLDQGDVVTAFFRPAVPCSPPTGFLVEPSFTMMDLSWNVIPDALSYQINWRKTGSNDDWETVSTVDNTYTIFGLEDCTEYDLQIRSICQFAVGDFMDENGTTDCINSTEEALAGVQDWATFPNPFSEQFTIQLDLATAQSVTATLYDLQGKALTFQDFGYLQSGVHQLSMEVLNDLADGVYFLQLQTEMGVVGGRVLKQ